MHGEGFFFQAFVFLLAAVIAVPVAKRLGLGSVLGYLLAGVAIGPFVLGLIGAEGQDVMHFAEFGVVMMLFIIGLELEPQLLWRLRAPILGLGGLQVGVTTLAIFAIGLAFALPWQSALAIGMVLALSSTAIVLQTLAEKGLMKTDAGQGSFAVLLFQDIAVIPMLALLPLLALPHATNGDGHASADPAAHAATDADHADDSAGGDHADDGHGEHASTSWVEGQPGWAQALIVLGVLGGIVGAGRFLIRPCFRIIAGTQLRELFTAAALLLVIGIALLMTRVGLSPALGTFVAGVVLANSEYRHELESDIEPFKGLLLGLFFIAVGASINFDLIAASPGTIAGLVVLLIVVKMAVLVALGRVFRMGLDQNLLFTFALAQGGEFAFVLFSFARQSGVIGGAIVDPLVAVVALSMAATPLLLVIAERVLLPRVGTREANGREPDKPDDDDHPVIIAGFGRFGSVVGRFLRANGVGCTVLDHNSDHVDVLRRLGIKVFYGDAVRHDLLHAAGAERAKLLIVAIDDTERALQLVHTARQHFPHLQILARASFRHEAFEMAQAGAGHVYRETLDSSLRMGVDAMRLVGHRAYRAQRAAHTFREHDEQSVMDLGKLLEDRRVYMSAARERIAELEQLLQSEEARPWGAELDEAWDTGTLRAEFNQPGGLAGSGSKSDGD